jgi:phosphoglycerol transferase
MVRAVIQSIDAKNRYRSGNNNMDGFHVIYDPLGPRYESNLSEGIIFNRDGYPSFVSGFKGISGKESWGRWTDSQEAVIEFISPLPRKFTLKIKAGASSAVVNNSVNIIIGDAQFNTKFVSQEPTEVEVNVTTDGKAKSITIKFPILKSPKELGLGADTRHLGLALIRLQISADISSK